MTGPPASALEISPPHLLPSLCLPYLLLFLLLHTARVALARPAICPLPMPMHCRQAAVADEMEARSHRIRIDQLVVVARARFPISHGAARTITCPAACGAGERIAHITSTPLLCSCVRACVQLFSKLVLLLRSDHLCLCVRVLRSSLSLSPAPACACVVYVRTPMTRTYPIPFATPRPLRPSALPVVSHRTQLLLHLLHVYFFYRALLYSINFRHILVYRVVCANHASINKQIDHAWMDGDWKKTHRDTERRESSRLKRGKLAGEERKAAMHACVSGTVCPQLFARGTYGHMHACGCGR